MVWEKLEAKRKFPPTSWDELEVSDYHGILSTLEAASGENLTTFRVTDNELKPRAVSARRRGYSGSPGSVTMGKKRYADTQRMLQRLEAVRSYFINRQAPPEPEAPPRLIGFR